MTIIKQAACPTSEKLANSNRLKRRGLPKGEILLDDTVRVSISKEILMRLREVAIPKLRSSNLERAVPNLRFAHLLPIGIVDFKQVVLNTVVARDSVEYAARSEERRVGKDCPV